MSGIVQGARDSGKTALLQGEAISVGATPEGELKTSPSDALLAETNRLLRVLIAVVAEGLGVETEQYDVDPLSTEV